VTNRERVWLTGIVAAVVVVTAAWFWPSVGGQFLFWDDDIYLAELQQDRGVGWAFTTIRPFYYHPLTWLSYFFDQRVAGIDPRQFHITNVVLHAANAGIVVVLAWLVGGACGMTGPNRLILAGGVGLVFGLHPLQVEPVAWVAERKTMLCALFSFATVCAYLRGWPRSERGWRLATVGLFAGALMAKPAAVTLPMVLLLLDFYPLDRYRDGRWISLLREKMPLLLLSAGSALLTILAQHADEAMVEWQGHGVVARGLTAARGMVFYVWKLAWPAWLSPFYPLGRTITFADKEFVFALAVCVVVTAIVVVLRRRWPVLLAAWGAYVLLVLPTSGLGQAGSQTVADRFAYLAMVPVLLLAGAGVLALARRLPVVGRVVLMCLVAGWIVFVARQARAQIPVWQNTEVMWRKVLQHYPRSGIAYANFALELMRQQRVEEAWPFVVDSVFELQPDHPATRQAALALLESQVRARAFERAAPVARRLAEVQPENADARAMNGLILLKTGQPEQAAAELAAAIRLKSGLVAARYNLACAYVQLGRLPEARDALRTLIAKHPDMRTPARADAALAPLRAAFPDDF